MATTQRVRNYLKQYNLDDRIHEFDVSSATVELAAKAAGIMPAQVCKTLSFKDDEGNCILIQTAGDTKIQNGKFKRKFGCKAKMLSPDEVREFTGYDIGGVCAFDIDDPGVRVFSDESLKRFDYVWPAAGNDRSGIKLTCDELFESSKSIEWVDVCKIPE